MRDIEIDLAGRTFELLGAPAPILAAVAAALRGNGGVPFQQGLPDLLIAACPLLPGPFAGEALLAETAAIGRQLAAGRGGRIVLLLSAMATLPTRRHPDYSVAMAAALAGMRGLAMQLGPQVLVNAVGAGVIEAGGELLAGDRIMLGHAGLPRPGSIEDVVSAVLFLSDPDNTYTTGQLLNVDGGWSVGYGRNF